MFYNIHRFIVSNHIPVVAGREACVQVAHLHMRKLSIKLSVLAALTLALLLLCAGALAGDVIQGTVAVSPKNLTGTGTVTVNITVSNISDDPDPVAVTLLDPNGNIVQDFGSGGVVYLKSMESRNYTGTWAVTEQQLEKGRVIYQLKYTAVTADGVKTPISEPIADTITFTSAEPNILVDRRTPNGSVVEGQAVKIGYVVTNTGGVDLTNITIKDPEIITGDPLTIALLKPTETVELSASYTAGATSKTSIITLSYSYSKNGKTETLENTSSPYVIDVTMQDISIQLAASQSIVNKDDKIDLILNITNRSNLSYTNVTITDPLLGTVEPGITLRPNSTEKITRNVTVAKSNVYRFTLTAKDSTGAEITVVSNDCSVQTIQDQGSAVTAITPSNLALEIVAEADRPFIYTQPSDIIFQIKVTNNSTAAIENITVAAVPPQSGTATTIKTIEKLEPGESVTFSKLLRASVGGQYAFSANVKGADGEVAKLAESTPIQVTFQVTSAPPTPSPEPTLPPTVPPSAEPTVDPAGRPWDDQGDSEGGQNRTLLYVIAIVLGVVIVAVVVIAVMDTRRRQPQGPSYRPRQQQGPTTVIDSLQRTERRDYARAPKRQSNRPQPQGRTSAQVQEDPMPPEEETDFEPQVQAEPKRAPRLRIEEETPAAPERNLYQRPQQEAAAQQPKPEPSGDKTEVLGQEYLTRIRRATAPRGESEEETPEAPQAKPARVSDEDAALLSGSTGQYRLSRKSGTVRETAKPSQQGETRNSSAYLNRLRSENDSRKSVAKFYDDDEDDGKDS